jgi:hypothetical protein
VIDMSYNANKKKPGQKIQGRPASRFSGTNGSSHSSDTDPVSAFAILNDSFSGGGDSGYSSSCDSSSSSDSGSCGGSWD